MPVYTTEANVKLELPATLPADLDTAWFTQHIADASSEVDSRINMTYGYVYASNTQKFPNVTDDPATPEQIEQAARYLCASHAYAKMGYVTKYTEEGKVIGWDATYARKARMIIRDINAGRANFVLSDGTALGEPAKSDATVQTLETGNKTDTDDSWTKVGLIENT